MLDRFLSNDTDDSKLDRIDRLFTTTLSRLDDAGRRLRGRLADQERRLRRIEDRVELRDGPPPEPLAREYEIRQSRRELIERRIETCREKGRTVRHGQLLVERLRTVEDVRLDDWLEDVVVRLPEDGETVSFEEVKALVDVLDGAAERLDAGAPDRHLHPEIGDGEELSALIDAVGGAPDAGADEESALGADDEDADGSAADASEESLAGDAADGGLGVGDGLSTGADVESALGADDEALGVDTDDLGLAVEDGLPVVESGETVEGPDFGPSDGETESPPGDRAPGGEDES